MSLEARALSGHYLRRGAGVLVRFLLEHDGELRQARAYAGANDHDPLAQPLETDARGYVEAWLERGHTYRLEIAGVPSQRITIAPADRTVADVPGFATLPPLPCGCGHDHRPLAA